MDAEPFLALAKEILSGSQKGKDQVEKIVNDIIQQLKDEDWEDASGETSTYDIPGFEGTMDALDDALDIRPKEEPKAIESPKEYDMDTLLDKIGKSGMDSLTQDEKDFLYNM